MHLIVYILGQDCSTNADCIVNVNGKDIPTGFCFNSGMTGEGYTDGRGDTTTGQCVCGFWHQCALDGTEACYFTGAAGDYAANDYYLGSYTGAICASKKPYLISIQLNYH